MNDLGQYVTIINQGISDYMYTKNKFYNFYEIPRVFNSMNKYLILFITLHSGAVTAIDAAADVAAASERRFAAARCSPLCSPSAVLAATASYPTIDATTSASAATATSRQWGNLNRASTCNSPQKAEASTGHGKFSKTTTRTCFR